MDREGCDDDVGCVSRDVESVVSAVSVASIASTVFSDVVTASAGPSSVETICIWAGNVVATDGSSFVCSVMMGGGDGKENKQK